MSVLHRSTRPYAYTTVTFDYMTARDGVTGSVPLRLLSGDHVPKLAYVKRHSFNVLQHASDKMLSVSRANLKSFYVSGALRICATEGQES